MKKIQKLHSGDVIRVVAPASPFDRKAFLVGVKILEGWGYHVVYRQDIFKREPYLAGSDQRRSQELIEALQDDDARAILFARGGYGCLRLLPYLDKMRSPKIPKLVLGYSDITSLHIYLYQRFGWPIFYGPVVAKDISPDTPAASLKSLQQCLSSAGVEALHFPQAKIIKSGKSSGELVGGCLTLVNAHCGTPYDLKTDKRILFLEDVNEKPYQIDRLLVQLELAGKFRKCRGVIFGSLSGPNPPAHYDQTLHDFFSKYAFPVISHLPFGHLDRKLCLPLGRTVTLSAGPNGARLQFA